MPIEITMPRLSDTMEEGTLVKWRVKLGDKVASGAVLADVETDKATMELQGYDEGVVAKLVAKEGDSMKVGALILVLATAGESVEEAAKSSGGGGAGPAKSGKEKAAGGGAGPGNATAVAQAEEEEKEETSGISPGTSGGGGRIRVSPLARKIAEQNGVDLARLKGSGPDGRIVKRDVLSAAPGTPGIPGTPGTPGTSTQAPAAGTSGGKSSQVATKPAPSVAAGAMLEAKTIPLTSMRKTIARRLVESKTTIPHFTVTVEADVDELMRMRGTVNRLLENQGVKLSVNDFIIRAAALAILKHPLVNASWSDAGIQVHGTVNLGVAVSLPAERGGGLVVPVIRDAQNKDLRTISAEVRALAEKARTRGLEPGDMAEGTFTISNLGMLGVDHFEAIINPPQVAILAVGAALERAVVRNGQVVPGWRMSMTLSADHRVVDGSMAAQYVNSVRELLEAPAALLI